MLKVYGDIKAENLDHWTLQKLTWTEKGKYIIFSMI